MQAEAAFSLEFPSVLADDTLEPSPYQAALFHLRQGLQALCDLSPGADPAKREEHEQLVALQKQVLQLLHIHFAPSGEEMGARFGEVLTFTTTAAPPTVRTITPRTILRTSSPFWLIPLLRT